MKITRKEAVEIAAHATKSIKTLRPDLGHKEMRSVASAIYHQHKEKKNA